MICTKCKVDQPNTNYDFRNKSKNIRHKRCRNCCRQEWNLNYRKNPKVKEDAVVRNNLRRDRHRLKVLQYLIEHPCIDCGEKDPVVLQFDHRQPSIKVNSVSRMIYDCSWSSISQEIAKCDVRCANCHTRRTAKQFNWFRIHNPVL